MSTQENGPYLNFVEWEGLQDKYIIKENISFPILPNTAIQLEVWRGDDYKIQSRLIGLARPQEKILTNGSPGDFIKPFEVSGEEHRGLEKYNLKYCYLGGHSSTIEVDNAGNYQKKYEAQLYTYDVIKTRNAKSKISWLTEWYINGPRMSFLYPRYTTRKRTKRYERNREVIQKAGGKLEDFVSESSSYDYAFIDCGEIKFIFHAVPEKLGPQWSKNVGLEYRHEFGRIPTPKEREGISEILSFLLGRNLLNVGYSMFAPSGFVVEERAKNPEGDNVRSVCQKFETPPIELGTYEAWSQIEVVAPCQRRFDFA